MRKLKSSMDVDQLNSFKQSNASYHRPTITYLSYKNNVRSAREPLSRSNSQRSLCGRYHNAIDTKKQLEKASKLPVLTNFLDERAKTVKKVFKIKKEQNYSLLTLKALQIRKIPDENETNTGREKEPKEKESARRKSLTSASIEPIKFNEASSASSPHKDETEMEVEPEIGIEYLFVNEEKIVDELLFGGANANSENAGQNRRNSVTRRNSTGRVSK
jgi:hypothetical protein